MTDFHVFCLKRRLSHNLVTMIVKNSCTSSKAQVVNWNALSLLYEGKAFFSLGCRLLIEITHGLNFTYGVSILSQFRKF